MATWQGVLDDLVRERRAALVGYAYLLTGDAGQAEDLVHEALVRTFSHSRGLNDPRAAEWYVRKAMVNTFINGLRKRRGFLDRQHLVVTPEAVPWHDVSVAETIAVQQALGVLSPRERACVVLRFFEDEPMAEIGAHLGISTGAVKRYLSDAITRLRGELGPMPDLKCQADDAGRPGAPTVERSSR